MRICRVSQTYPTTSNEGKGLHAYFISNLVEKPTLVLTKHYDEEYLTPAPHVDLKPIKYWQIPFPESNKLSIGWLFALFSFIVGQFQFVIKSIYYIGKFKPNIVHLQSPHAFLIGWYARVFHKAKVVVTFHGSDLRRVKKNKFYMKMLNKFDRFFYVTSEMKPTLQCFFGKEKLLYTPSGVDIDFFANVNYSTERENILLAVGNLRWQKDYPTMLKAFSQILQEFPMYKLVVIGGGEEKAINQTKVLIKELNIEHAVELLGYQNRFVIRDYMQKAKLFLLSSATEGMPKVIHESMCSKLPVIATNVGACKALVDNAGRVVEPGDPKAFAIAVSSILSNESAYRACVENAQQKGLKYSWKSNSLIILSEFKKLVFTNN